MTPFIYWIIVAALAAVAELSTTAFVAMYFALGAVAAAFTASAGGDTTLQLIVFSLVCVVLMLLTRPHLKHLLESPDVPMNVHAVVGKVGIVTEPIRGLGGRGQIRVGSEFWTARGIDEDDVIDVGARVIITEIEGVSAIVMPLDD